MPSGRARKIVSGLGAVLLTVCIAAALIHFNDWTKTHSSVVSCVMYISGLGAIACFLFWYFSSESTTQSSAGPTTTSVNVPSSATNNAPVNVNVGPFNIGNIPPVATSEPPKPQPIPEPKFRPPLFEFAPQFQMSLSYDNSIGSWKDTPYQGKFSFVIWVTNPVAAVGEKRPTIQSVAAHLKLQCKNGLSIIVPRAYWLNQPANEVTLSAGKPAGLVIGSSEDGVWTTYDNPHETSPYNDSFFRGFARLDGGILFHG